MTATARRFTRLPLDVAAVQWDGSNAAEMVAVLGGHLFSEEAYLGDGGAGVFTTKHSSWTPIERGDWAVLGPGGSVAVMDDDDFTAMFAAVGDA